MCYRAVKKFRRSQALCFFKTKTTGNYAAQWHPKTIDDVLQMRRNPDMFAKLCDTYMPCMMKKTVWKKHKSLSTVSALCSITSEAFLYLLMDNNWEYWTTKISNNNLPDGVPKVKEPDPKYTCGKHRFGRNGGWSDSGMQRFNELCELIVTDRKKTEGIETEKQMMEKWEREKYEERDVQKTGEKKHSEVFTDHGVWQEVGEVQQI